MKVALLLGFAAAASAVELTPDNFDDLVHGSGKSAFVKFQAPW
jgi:hypothetical protein